MNRLSTTQGLDVVLIVDNVHIWHLTWMDMNPISCPLLEETVTVGKWLIVATQDERLNDLYTMFSNISAI